MKLRTATIALTLVAAGLALTTGSVGATAAPTSRAAAAAAPYCGLTWGSLDRESGVLSVASLSAIRTGQHACFDRLVFELDGPANGYRVHYGEAYTQGQGMALSPFTAGGAVLEVVLLTPTSLAIQAGAHPLNVAGYRTLRDVVGGGSFEGYTTFAVGVRARLPFQVTVLSGPGTHSRIVLDVAHLW